MSSHADTIRQAIYASELNSNYTEAALDALLAENQRLREALRFYAYNPQYAGDIAREALAGDAE